MLPAMCATILLTLLEEACGFFLEEAHTCMHADASNETPHFLYILFDIYIYIYIYYIIYIYIYMIIKSGVRHVWEWGKVPWAS